MKPIMSLVFIISMIGWAGSLNAAQAQVTPEKTCSLAKAADMLFYELVRQDKANQPKNLSEQNLSINIEAVLQSSDRQQLRGAYNDLTMSFRNYALQDEELVQLVKEGPRISGVSHREEPLHAKAMVMMEAVFLHYLKTNHSYQGERVFTDDVNKAKNRQYFSIKSQEVLHKLNLDNEDYGDFSKAERIFKIYDLRCYADGGMSWNVEFHFSGITYKARVVSSYRLLQEEANIKLFSKGAAPIHTDIELKID